MRRLTSLMSFNDIELNDIQTRSLLASTITFDVRRWLARWSMALLSLHSINEFYGIVFGQLSIRGTETRFYRTKVYCHQFISNHLYPIENWIHILEFIASFKFRKYSPNETSEWITTGGVDMILCDIRIKMEPKVSGPSVYDVCSCSGITITRDERIYLNRKTSKRPFGELAFRVRAKIVKRTNMWVQVVCASQCFTYKNLLELLEMRCNMNSISISAVNSSFNTVTTATMSKHRNRPLAVCFCRILYHNFCLCLANGRVGSLVHCLNE